MKNIKRFVVILLVVCSVFIAASCKNCGGTTEPKTVPSLSNPDGIYLQIGNYKITNKEVYHQLLNSYGLEALLNEIDDAILPAVENEDDFQEYLDNVIYGDEEKTEEALNEYLESLTLSGLSKNPDDDNYYVDYHKLIYRRLQYAKAVFKSEITEETFTEENKENKFETAFRKNNDLIIIRFNSQNEANAHLKANNIDLSYVNTGWQKTDGTKLESTQVQAVFENIYKSVNDVETSGVKTYTYEELTNINSSLASAAYNLGVNEYTKVPTTYGSYVYLIYKVSETANLDKDGNAVTLEEKADEVINLLVEDSVSNTYATMVSLENHADHNLKIYSLALETVYKTSYESVYSSLGYETDEYDAFVRTDEESSTVLFSYELNGSKVEITAEEVFQTLNHNYGNYITSLYLKQYIVLENNPVFDIVTGEIKDQTKYDSYYKTEVSEYKDAFNNGDYESIGYPSSYGWENFIRDYLGTLSDQKILMNLDSSLYEDSLEEYKEQFYLDDEGQPVDQKVQDKMTEIFNNYLSATAVGIKAYYDNNFDGKADEIESGSTNEALLKDLIALVYDEAVKEDLSIDAALKKIILQYNISSSLSNNTWSKYRQAGLQLSLVNSATFSSTSSQDDTIKNEVRKVATKILDLEKEDNGEFKLSGKDLSNYTTITNDDKVTKSFRSTDFISVSGEDSNIIVVDGAAQLYFVTKASKPYYIEESKGTYKPAYLDYESYLEDASDVSTNTKNCITTYYIPAINELASDKVVTNSLVDKAIELANSSTVSNKDSLIEYLNACKIVDEE